MNKKAIVISLLLALAAPAARSEEAKEAPGKMSSLMMYFKNLKLGLTDSAVRARYQKGRSAAVAAVRGSDQDDSKADLNKPQMKDPSKTRSARQEKKERAAFESAVDLIMAGKPDEGIAALDAFEKAYPKSSELSGVRAARSKAQELKDAQGSAAPESAKAQENVDPKPEAQPETK